MGITCASGLWGGHAFFWEEESRVNSPTSTQTRRKREKGEESQRRQVSTWLDRGDLLLFGRKNWTERGWMNSLRSLRAVCLNLLQVLWRNKVKWENVASTYFKHVLFNLLTWLESSQFSRQEICGLKYGLSSHSILIQGSKCYPSKEITCAN